MSASRTVYADGVFDLTHYGHHRMLQKAKSFGDTLIVGVHLDSDVATYKRTPILTHAERTKNLEAISLIDRIVVGPLIITEEFMQDNNIDVVVHAHDAKDDDRYAQMYKAPQDLGKFVRLDYTSEISTTDIIARVQAIPMDVAADN